MLMVGFFNVTSVDHQNSIRQFLDKEHEEAMFEYIVTQAKQVAIGPLEYCGNAKVMETSHGKKRYV